MRPQGGEVNPRSPMKQQHGPFPGLETNPERPSLAPSSPLKVVVIGAGSTCFRLLKALTEDRAKRIPIAVLGVADLRKDAPGFEYAVRCGVLATTDVNRLLRAEGLEAVLDLTGSMEAGKQWMAALPPGVSWLDRRTVEALILPFVTRTADPESSARTEPRLSPPAGDIQTILDSLPYRIMVVNPDKTIATVNRTFLRENGLDYDEVLGRPCYEVRYGLHAPCKEFGRPCYMEDLREKGEIISTYHEYQDEEGETRYDVITVSPIFDENGRIVQILEASRDVTDRILLQRKAQETSIFLNQIIQSTVDGIVVVDTKGRVLLFNPGMERLTGYRVEEIMEHGHLTSFYNIDVAKENMRKMRSEENGPLDKLNPTSMSITTKYGEEIPVTLSASIIRIDGKEVGSVGVFRDMREILKMRRDLEEAHLQLVQSEKIASVGRMAAGVAHEINNPLSGILIFAELLKETLEGDRQKTQDIQEIIDQTLRCKQIVSDLLEFSRQSIGKATSFSLNRLIEKCLDLLVNQAIFHDIEVVRDLDPDMPEMVGDMGQLQQVFTNLFLNAADAMDGKGRLEIQLRFDPTRSRFFIRVSDTGPGIPPEHRHKIFDIFFTTKPVGKGTGLGLSISQNIIKLHGGSITFRCPPGGGTTFIIELPLEYQEEEMDEPVFVGLNES